MKKNGVTKTIWANREYILFYSRILLKQRVAGNYLGILWLFIQPFMFMLIYSFVVIYVFRSQVENINVYVLIGMNAWNMFSRTVMNAATSVTSHKNIFKQVYVHKSVFVLTDLLCNVYEFFIAISLVLVLMVFSGIPFTLHIFELFPALFVAMLFTYGVALIAAHIGVYVYDLRNILEFTLRFVFYLSPIMWSYESLHFEWSWVLLINPIYVLLNSFRRCLMWGESPAYLSVSCLGLFSVLLVQIGYRLISKYEDQYARLV